MDVKKYVLNIYTESDLHPRRRRQCSIYIIVINIRPACRTANKKFNDYLRYY